MKIRKSYLISVIFIGLILLPLIFSLDGSRNLNNSKSRLHSASQTYHTNQWIENPSFENSTDDWYSSAEGDIRDVDMNVNNGSANFQILGEKQIFSMISDPPTASNWTQSVNPNYPNLPDIAEITDYGCRASHEFDDVTAVQDPCVQWDQNITLPVNISDYTITSASIQAIVNATVDENLDRFWDYYFSRLARNDPDNIVDTYSVGDYIRFYITISDVEKNKVYEIAYHQTQQIGSGSPPGKDYLYDTYITSVPEDVLIFYLTSVLNGLSQFTITIGIRLHIEDNVANYWDLDTFDEMYIKYVNLTFMYEKNINRLTSLFWSQMGDSISGNNIEITSAILNFKYKIDDNCLKTLTLNSEMRVLINNYACDANINLNSMNSTFQELELDGLDVTSLILKDVNISLTFQIFLADDFILDRIVNISIDDVNLNISYLSYYEEDPPLVFLIILLLVISIILISILSALSVRSYVLLPRKRRKEVYLLQRTQKFKDVSNIQAIILIHRSSGLPIYSQSFSEIIKGKNTLFSGFIQAVSIIGEEITKETEVAKEKKRKDKLTSHKVVELDLKQFHCLILDVEELRTVIILKSKASKRLKDIMVHFSFALYLKISDKLKDFDNDLNPFKEIIPPLIVEYFDIYYKDPFKLNITESQYINQKKTHNLSKIEARLMHVIFLISKEKSYFKLMDILEKVHDKDENIVINALESLIEYKLISPIKYQI